MTAADSLPPIAIIGFGFSGLMLLANLLRETSVPRTIYVIDPQLDARGAAYRSTEPLHLLNVVAERMGAWSHAHDDFLHWLTAQGAPYAAGDYAPRMLYGEYLESIWRAAQALAAQKNCSIKLVQSRAVAIHPTSDGLTIATERGDAIAVSHAVLALGNEAKKLYPHLPAEKVIQRPWDDDALAGVAASAKSIALIGTSLTAVDALLSLRAAGYEGKIAALSRHGRLPQAHRAEKGSVHPFQRRELLTHVQSLSQLLRFIRQTIRNHHNNWRAVIDGLRPPTQAVWRSLSAPDQKRFFARLAGIWNVHRHRIAPSISATIDAEIAAQQCSVIAAKNLHAEHENNYLTLHWNDAEGAHALPVDAIVNCTGVHFDVTRSRNPLLQQLLSSGLIEPHITGMGIGADAALRVHGLASDRLYVMGGLLTGQLLETIAVPELREQAARLARHLLTH